MICAVLGRLRAPAKILDAGQRPASRSSRSAALTAYPATMAGARKSEPITRHVMISVTQAGRNPEISAAKNPTIATP